MLRDDLADLSVSSSASDILHDEVESIKKFTDGSIVVDAADLRYSKTEPVGEGTTALVFQGMISGENVAIKVLKVLEGGVHERLEELERDLVAFSAGMQHPNIIGFRGSGVTEAGLPMLVFEYAEGGSMEDLLLERVHGKRTSWVSPDKSMAWCHQLFSSLAYLHDRKSPLAHRDIKPGNLLLSADHSTIKLSDFSLSCPIDDCTTHIAYIPSIAGSLRYMAPEIMVRKPYSITKTDIYSATITSWAMIVGRMPFESLSESKAISDAIKGCRPPVKRASLRAMLEAGWHHQPARRPCAADMAAFFASQLPSSRPSSTSFGGRVLTRLRRWARVSPRCSASASASASSEQEEEKSQGSFSLLRSGCAACSAASQRSGAEQRVAAKSKDGTAGAGLGPGDKARSRPPSIADNIHDWRSAVDFDANGDHDLHCGLAPDALCIPQSVQPCAFGQRCRENKT
eukprot:3139137-Rhodomonas_salina.2